KESEYQTYAAVFLLLEFSVTLEVQFMLFGLFLFMYLDMFTGNLLIILTICSDCHLHTPMYFFLSNLSSADICFTSTTGPKMLLTFCSQQSHNICRMPQPDFYFIFFACVFGCLDNLLLIMMTYDHCVAICHPPALPGHHESLALWAAGLGVLVLQALCAVLLHNHGNMTLFVCVCDFPEILKLACSDTLINNKVLYSATGLLAVSPFQEILSYNQILSSIPSTSSVVGKYKVIPTCTSHHSVVSLFYGTGLGVDFSSTAMSSTRMNLVASVMCTIDTPMLNPSIYTLRNRDMKGAMNRSLDRMFPLSIRTAI
uniref:G-protein coupled receptors family 1 profile domain-containing protein n=1 Tax=Mustela putorius furo TaxID=9669 RepID=M3Y380_MUSPF